MDLNRFSTSAFEALAPDGAAARKLAHELADFVAAEVEAAARKRFAEIASTLNQFGHRLAAYGRAEPDQDEYRDYTDPNQCALRLALGVEVAPAAGYKDVRFEGGWAEEA